MYTFDGMVLVCIINSSCALDSGSTFFGPNALIMDGASLSTAMHARGINIRYLGRVLYLLEERENSVAEESKIEVVPTPSTSTTNGTTPAPATPTPKLPHFMTTIAATELISRAAKHVFNPFIQVVAAFDKIRFLKNCVDWK